MQNTLLNLTPGAYSPEVHLSQYDKGRTIPFKLMDGNAEYTVPSGAVIKVKATKPSGLGFVVDCTYDGGTVTITNTETMSNEAGRFPAELSISVGNTLLGTANFIFNVERSPHPEGTTDGDAETLLPELTLLVKEIRESNAKVESMTASATALPDGATPTAEYDSESNNLAFGIPTPDVTKSELLNLYITKSASGSIASFSDGADDVPLKSLKVNIVPKQSGSGDPSPTNIRSISGYDTVNVTRCGKNLFNHTLTTRTVNGTTFTVNADKSITISGTPTEQVRVAISSGIVTDGNVAKYFSTGGMPSGTRIYCRKVANGSTSYPTISPDAQFRVGEVFDNLAIEVNTSFSGTAFTIYPMVEVGSTATAYEPYNGTTYTISLGQTVYGGTLDVISGKLVIDRAIHNMTSSDNLSWNGTIAGKSSEWVYAPNPAKKNGTDNFISDKFKTATTVNLYDIGGRANNGNLYFHLPESIGNSGTQAKQWFADNPTTVCYELETPTEIQLTPTEVKSLLGSNNIWADSGDSEAEYRADSTLAYEELANAIISLGGNI